MLSRADWGRRSVALLLLGVALVQVTGLTTALLRLGVLHVAPWGWIC